MIELQKLVFVQRITKKTAEKVRLLLRDNNIFSLELTCLLCDFLVMLITLDKGISYVLSYYNENGFAKREKMFLLIKKMAAECAKAEKEINERTYLSLEIH